MAASLLAFVKFNHAKVLLVHRASAVYLKFASESFPSGPPKLHA